MKRTIKHVAIAAIAVIFLVLNFPTTAYATHGIASGYTSIYVDGVEFEVWGYFEFFDSGPGPMHAFRLGDIAYILNGTPAQFEVLTPPDDRWDFWIQRGAPYTPTGDEMQPIPDRMAHMTSFGFNAGGGFYTDPFQTIILGIDGEDTPATTIAFNAFIDADDTFFSMHKLGELLGFELSFEVCEDSWYRSTPEVIFTHENAVFLPNRSPEFIDLMIRLSGSWVDSAHFDSPTIDESVVWPVAFSIEPHGFSDTVQDGSRIAPIDNYIRNWELREFYSLQKRELENGLIELTIDPTGNIHRRAADFTGQPYHEALYDITRFNNHRIIVDTRQTEEITLYIDDTAFQMTRFPSRWELGARNASRYYALPLEDGGIVVRYVIAPFSTHVWDLDVEFNIYRATESPRRSRDRGERIYTHQLTGFYDRFLFEFTDPTAKLGNVYYYTLRIGGFGALMNYSEDRIYMRIDLTEYGDENENEIETATPHYNDYNSKNTNIEPIYEIAETITAYPEYPESSQEHNENTNPEPIYELTETITAYPASSQRSFVWLAVVAVVVVAGFVVVVGVGLAVVLLLQQQRTAS
ncbi:MAG: hypothetical protein FWC89_04045 [Defluviitaleaceae bacterium]|nr:hypothetical protein [Defluviitaleaceae bacterium]